MKSLAFLSAFLCCTLHAQQPSLTPRKPLTHFDKLKDGDLVFIASSTDRAGLIQKLTGSELSHCGIVFLDAQRKAHVYEGAGRNDDTHVTIEEWQKKESTHKDGRTDSPLHSVHVRRLVTGLSDDQIRTVKGEAAKLHHTHYDCAFQMGNPENNQAGREYVYCSELIYRAFQSIDVILGSPRLFSYYHDKAVGDDRRKMDETLNSPDANKLRNPKGPYNPNESVISPEDIYVSDKLRDVNDETPVAALTASAWSVEFTVTEAVKHAGAADGSALTHLMLYFQKP